MKSVFLFLLLFSAAVSGGHAVAREGKKMGDIRVSSPAFEGNSFIPRRYTCDGADVNPPIALADIPAAAKSMALIVDDPDAPVGTWVHWVLWNIPPATREIAENSAPEGAVQGKNDWRRNNYGGPCPPSGAHRYFFKLYALDAVLSISPGSTKADLERAMKGHLLAHGELVGLYKRK